MQCEYCGKVSCNVDTTLLPDGFTYDCLKCRKRFIVGIRDYEVDAEEFLDDLELCNCGHALKLHTKWIDKYEEAEGCTICECGCINE